MDVPETSAGKARVGDAPRLAGPRDPGEVRTLALTLAAAAVLIYLIRAILLPFVVAGIIAYICTPAVNWMARRSGLPRASCAFLMFFLLIALLGLGIGFGGRSLLTEAIDTASDLQGTIEHVARQASGDRPFHLFGKTFTADEFAKSLIDRALDWFAQSDGLAMLAGFSLAALMGLVLTLALLCYFLVGGPSIAHGLMWTVPPSRRALVGKIAARVDPQLKRYFLGMLVIVLYVTGAAYIGLGLVLKIDHAPLLAVLTGMLETVPIIGSTSASILAGLVSLHTATGLGSIIAFAAYVVVLRLTNDQIVAPLVLGGAAQLHPALIIFCFFAGAVLLGIPGVILAVPFALTAKTTLEVLYGEDAA